MCRLYANTMLFYIGNLNIDGCWYPWKSWDQSSYRPGMAGYCLLTICVYEKDWYLLFLISCGIFEIMILVSQKVFWKYFIFCTGGVCVKHYDISLNFFLFPDFRKKSVGGREF